MRAMDVMTTKVITVGENATVPEVAKLLAEHGISAIPVIDKDDRVIGMVSEGDLLHRAETGTERRRSWWLETGISTDQLAAEYIKSHSGKVGEVMTSRIEPDQPAGDVFVQTRRLLVPASERSGASFRFNSSIFRPSCSAQLSGSSLRAAGNILFSSLIMCCCTRSLSSATLSNHSGLSTGNSDISCRIASNSACSSNATFTSSPAIGNLSISG